MAGTPWRASGRGVVLRVRLTPRSSRDEIAGVGQAPDGPALLARVRAVPEAGAANAALERLVADWLGVPRRTVSLDAGGKSRSKTLLIEGDPATLAAALAAKAAALGA